MNEWLKNYFTIKTDPEIQFLIDENNFKAAKILSLITMLIEVVTISVSFVYQVYTDVPNPKSWILTHRIVYALTFLAATQLFVYTILHEPVKNRYSHIKLEISISIFVISIISLGIYISILDYIYDGQIISFMSMSILSCTLFLVKPPIAHSFIILIFAFFYILMQRTKGVTASTNITYLVHALILIIANTIKYNTFLRLAYRTLENRDLTRQLTYMSLYDSLTKIKNRHALREDFDLLINKPLMIMLADIDNFKSMNDTYGHNYGDEILCEFSTRLQKAFGEHYCYRYGGDEFLVIIPYISEKDFLTGITKCQNNIAPKISFSGGYTKGTPNTTDGFRELLTKADQNLYKAKKNGKDMVAGDDD